jgi:hypothetical protein
MFNAHVYLGNSKKAISLANKYLSENPNSFYAMNLLLNYYAKKANSDKIKEITGRMSYVYPYISELLEWISVYSANSSEKEYLKSLKTEFAEFKAAYKTNPEIISKISALKASAPTDTAKIYFLLVKTYAIELLQELFLSEKLYKEMESTKDEALANINEVVIRDPKYISTGILFSFIMENYMTYCNNQSLNDRTVQFCKAGIDIFEKNYPDTKFFYINYCIGNLYLNLASTADKANETQDAQKYAKSAILYFEKTLPYLINLNFSTARYLYSNIGEAYLLDGKYYAREGDLIKAKGLFEKSLIYLEKNLEISPIYGSKSVKLRKELYNLKEKYKI